MDAEFKTDTKYIVDLNMLNSYNKNGCESCHQKFNLGDTVVMAYGYWEDDHPRLIHERDAVFDKNTKSFYERKYYHAIN